MNGHTFFLLVCFIHLRHTGLAGVTSYMAGWIFIHLCHWAVLTQPHCAYNQKLGAPIHSTLLYDFEYHNTLVQKCTLVGSRIKVTAPYLHDILTHKFFFLGHEILSTWSCISKVLKYVIFEELKFMDAVFWSPSPTYLPTYLPTYIHTHIHCAPKE